MIWGTWLDPNFFFRAADDQGHEVSYFCHAVSEAALRERLTRKGLTVLSIEPYDFADWKRRAREATVKVIWQRVKHRWGHFRKQVQDHWPWLSEADLDDLAGSMKKLLAAIQAHDGCDKTEAWKQVEAWSETIIEETVAAGEGIEKTAIKFNENLYRELNWHLFEIFRGKCAYCESKPRAVSRGDVEHYRPKGKVDEDEHHPGYYWLAYDQTNLLPACILCNQYRAKMTHFPVEGAHSREPRNLNAEKPLLLNPYDRTVDPIAHLEFDEAGKSRAFEGSLRGVKSRECYHLDRPDLTEARFVAMQQVEQDWNTHINREVSIAGAYKKLHAEIGGGEREYAAAQFCQLRRLRKRTIKELEELG